MNTTKLLITLPVWLKENIDTAKAQGYTASGLIRHFLEQQFKGKQVA